MLRSSIRIKILAVTIGLIVLMVATAVLSLVLVKQIDHRLEQLTQSYIPIYGALARTNIRSLERALALRRMIIAKMQLPPDLAAFSTSHDVFDAKEVEVTREGEAARALINRVIEAGESAKANIAMARLDARIEVALNENRRDLEAEISHLLSLLDGGNVKAAGDTFARVDALRDAFQNKIEVIRSDMLDLVQRNVEGTLQQQRTLLVVAFSLTALSALMGITFAIIVSGGMTRPVRDLLAGTRAVEAGDFDATLVATTTDEIGHLTTAFNRMVEQLRLKERIRTTLGRYIDPRIVEGLLDQPEFSVEGQRRVMTVLFCDLMNFTRISEGMTPSTLLRLINSYLSIMSEPVRARHGIVDKYIGDAIMAYWGPPFTEAADQARLACLAALDMSASVAQLRADLPEITGMRHATFEIDIRIGIATGEVVVGSLGSAYLKSYTVIGDTTNLAARLEAANKVYNTRLLVSAATAASVEDDVELREIDQVIVAGQSTKQTIFEVMARKGELTSQQITLRAHYASGLIAYRAGRWNEASRCFADALEAIPKDGPSTILLQRATTFAAEPARFDWDGTWRLDHK